MTGCPASFSKIFKITFLSIPREGRKSGRKEDMVYNMAHLKTLPTTWFIASLKAQ